MVIFNIIGRMEEMLDMIQTMMILLDDIEEEIKRVINAQHEDKSDDDE